MTRASIIALVKNATAMTVQTGPFVGLRMVDRQTWGQGEDIGPQLLGTYEQELHTSLQIFVARSPTTIVNIGCAEGYYAVGLARLLPKARVFAFDTDVAAQNVCRENAVLNGVGERIIVEGVCTPSRLAEIAKDDPNIFAIIDCEGYEEELLSSSESVQALAHANALIEGHNLPSGSTIPAVQRSLRASHWVSSHQSSGRNPHVFPFLDRCADIDKWLLVCENRPIKQTWLACESRYALPRGMNMQSREVKLRNGRTISFMVSHQPDRESFFVLGVRKSGSTVLNSIVTTLAKFNDVNYVNVAGKLFQENVKTGDWIRDPALAEILSPGNVYGAFRNLPFSLAETAFFRDSRKMLLVRDPRDGLVSEYFSNAYSHSIPAPAEGTSSEVTRQMTEMREKTLSTTIDDAVLERAAAFNQTLIEYKILIEDQQLLLLKYEDVIVDKAKLIESICKHFGWGVTKGQLQKILGWADVMPKSENEKSFIRKVVPGDHLEKLLPSTIEKLNILLRPSMHAFGYAA